MSRVQLPLVGVMVTAVPGGPEVGDIVRQKVLLPSNPAEKVTQVWELSAWAALPAAREERRRTANRASAILAFVGS